MVNDQLVWGGPSELSAWEALMWRAEGDPRTRSTGILLEMLDTEPEWGRFEAALARTVDRFSRLRDRVVEPTLPVVQPMWSPDPEFELTYHVRHEPMPASSDDRQLMALCESLLAQPIDRARPPWQAILVTGLEGGRAAVVFKFHHSLTDGLGLVQLLALAHGSADAEESSTTPTSARSRRPHDVLLRSLGSRLVKAPAALVRGASDTAVQLGAAAGHPRAQVTRTVHFARSLQRMLTPPPVGGSPLLAGSGTGSRLIALDVSLEELKVAGKASGGSVNDAFVAAVLGGMRRYHERHGARRDLIPIAMPVSLRKSNDPLGGNRFAGVRFAAPLSETDPVRRIELIRDYILEVREEPAIGFLDYLAPALTKLPTAAIVELSASLTSTSDVQISNIRGIDHPVHLAGSRVSGMYPLGPRPGVAAMVAMITYDGSCCLGLNVDPDVFEDADVLELCIRDGFEEVLEVGRTPGRGTRTLGDSR